VVRSLVVMSATGVTLFDTPIGTCAIGWGERGIAGVLLPDARELQTPAYLLRRFPGAVQGEPPPEVAEAIEAIVGLLSGTPDDLAWIELDLDAVPPFQRRVYEEVRRIPPGQTQTYGEIAARVGDGMGAAQAVGRAMGANPFPIVVPCHRVVGADGRPGGFSAGGGVETKLRMLRIEGAPAGGAPTLF
jgi:methylated-DNA-[protein]-cysteine S-methyltransferase